MWNLQNTIIFSFVCCTACISAENCDPIYKLPNWEISEFEPPARLRLGRVPEVAAGLEAQVEKRLENFTLTLFANPFIKNGNCPSANSSYHNLRQFHKPYHVTLDGEERKSLFFGKIFTGCYYVEMKNNEGKRWLWDPVFYQTNYHYYDTMLTCKKLDIKTKNNNRASQLGITLEVPLTCSQVQIRLFELPKISVQLLSNWISGDTQIFQDCWVKNIGDGHSPEIRCSKPDTGVRISATPVDKSDENERWSADITWDFISKDNTSYYAFFELKNGNCNIDYTDLMAWKPVVNFGSILAGVNESNAGTYAYNSLDYS